MSASTAGGSDSCGGSWGPPTEIAEGGLVVQRCTGCGEQWAFSHGNGRSISRGIFPADWPAEEIVASVLEEIWADGGARW